MLKRTHFLGHTEAGVFAQGLFASMEKTAGVPGMAWDNADEIRKFVRTIGKGEHSKNAYVLVNALGAGEYYGSNINADWFPWNALTHEGDDYGYKTFLNAHAFAHHANKDPNHAFGVPVVSVLNPRMKRVELIIKLDREKARLEGADGVINRIDSGEFPDVSMGCRVPYDVCYVCGHQSKTRDDYCQHMRPPPDKRDTLGPNKILPDGRRICVINTLPRFFDISFVFIGADKTAKVMAKLASVGSRLCIGSVCATPQPSSVPADDLYDNAGRRLDLGFRKTASACGCNRGPCGGLCAECADEPRCSMDKLASAFGMKTAQQKLSTIVKSIPAGVFSAKKLPGLEASEPDLPPEVLDRMAEHPLPGALGTATAAGMVLKPREFQRIVLIRMGHLPMADELDEEGLSFRPVPRFGDVDPVLSIVRAVLQALAPYIQARTAFEPSLGARSVLAPDKVKKTLPTRGSVEHPLLDKISAAYNGYRRNVLMKLSQAREVALGDPQLRSMILGDELVNMFLKTASTDEILSHDSVAYMMGAHLSDKSLLSTAAVAGCVAVANPRLREELSA